MKRYLTIFFLVTSLCYSATSLGIGGNTSFYLVNTNRIGASAARILFKEDAGPVVTAESLNLGQGSSAMTAMILDPTLALIFSKSENQVDGILYECVGKAVKTFINHNEGRTLGQVFSAECDKVEE